MAERASQRSRTRKDLLQAASRLMARGRSPTLEEVAEEAMVSRATAYRYFPGVEPLLVEAVLDLAAPDPAALLDGDAPRDPVARVARVDAAFDAMMAANEPGLRAMLAHSLTRTGDGPRRQNRRSALIDAALEPGEFAPDRRDLLAKALAMIVGTEGMIALRDVLQLDDAEARRVKDWAIAALVAAARR